MTDTIHKTCSMDHGHRAGELTRDELARAFKALGHPTRLKIVEHLLSINTCVCGELVDIFPFSQSTISQHLKQLKDARIVCGEVEGPRTYFCVDRQVLGQVQAFLDSLHKGEMIYDV